jgi:CIC family chloride channel protein
MSRTNPIRRYLPDPVRQDLAATYARDLHKWVIVAPVVGVIAGLLVTVIATAVLRDAWPPVFAYYLAHHWAIVPGLLVGSALTGLVMQMLTPNPNQHSSEEIIVSYHEHEGAIDMRPFFPKLLAAVMTVVSGGSTALEGPSIYGGGAIGSWVWERLHRIRRLRLDARDRRIMLICGAAAGMSAVFRAPLTGIVFALEMPYRDDLAHEALLPSLIASVVSYATLTSFLGSTPVFNFASSTSYTRRDLLWSAVLGVGIGLIALVFVISFRRFRRFMVELAVPHWTKLAAGGLLTGLTGLLFVRIFPGELVPLGPNYEAVGLILNRAHGTHELVSFAGFKLLASAFTLGTGGVSAMFVPLFLCGGTLGVAFAQSVVHSPALELYAAVGMASFLAAGYKTPLAAVVFVAEATGGHAFIIPALIGAAIAYAVSGDASVSADQVLHERVKFQEMRDIPVCEVMREQVISVEASTSLSEFMAGLPPRSEHEAYPVFEGRKHVGILRLAALARIPGDRWRTTPVREVADRDVPTLREDAGILDAVPLLLGEAHHPLLLVISGQGELRGILTKTDILDALDTRREAREEPEEMCSV